MLTSERGLKECLRQTVKGASLSFAKGEVSLLVYPPVARFAVGLSLPNL